MTILVTGSNGFVGAAVVRRLVADGKPVRALVRAGSDRSRLDAAVHVGSLASPRAAAEAIGDCDTIIHLAARLRGAPADVYRDTVVASNNLIDAALGMKKPPRIVLVSSLAVYGVAELKRGSVIDEQTPLEREPLRRDLYAQAKLRQEKLFFDRCSCPLVVVRPGVVYGPGGTALSTRVGLQLPGLFLFLGGDNLLPLTYVDNCADAIAVAAERGIDGEAYNVIDDDLVSARRYLARYRREASLRSLEVPYPLLWLGAGLVERYSAWSKGQLPPLLTPYKVASMHKSMRYANDKLRALGWQPAVTIDEGMRRTFERIARAA